MSVPTPKKNTAWFTLKNQAGQPAELLIYDVIGDWAGLSARELVSTLKNIDSDSITVRINSPGGSVFDGIAIYNALRYHPATVNVRIEGMAASIASVIAMAGDTITMAENALMMIHNPFGWVGGGAEEMRKVADLLDKTTEVIANTYCHHCEHEPETIKQMMQEETWFTAEEAKTNGLVDSIDSPVTLAAHFDLSGFRKAPAVTPPPAASVITPDNTHALAIMRLCNQAGYPELAEGFVEKQLGLEAAKQRLEACEVIQSLCAAAHCPERAKAFIQSGKTEDDVRKALFDQLTRDDISIDNTLNPQQQTQPTQPLLDTQSIYRKRNQSTAP
ncbi:Clp protease ClpP [Endozoicomonas sp. Mp262]|uniref:head maturation protease, ClpP-related n=1 Tax=Endozoicomonas sp. Mp262 TaxID=2919499 RepID=UPI0021D92812